MEATSKGWIVINTNHPTQPKKDIITDTFRYTRKESIKAFIWGTGSSWKYWYRTWNFRCVKAECTIVTYGKKK